MGMACLGVFVGVLGFCCKLGLQQKPGTPTKNTQASHGHRPALASTWRAKRASPGTQNPSNYQKIFYVFLRWQGRALEPKSPKSSRRMHPPGPKKAQITKSHYFDFGNQAHPGAGARRPVLTGNRPFSGPGSPFCLCVL
jgi:hypothetical protein